MTRRGVAGPATQLCAAVALLHTIACDKGEGGPSASPEQAVPPLTAKNLEARLENSGRLQIDFEVVDSKGKSVVVDAELAASVVARGKDGTEVEVCRGTDTLEAGKYARNSRAVSVTCDKRPPEEASFEARVAYSHEHGKAELATELEPDFTWQALGPLALPPPLSPEERRVALGALLDQLPAPGAPAVPCRETLDLGEPEVVDSLLLAELLDRRKGQPREPVDQFRWLSSYTYRERLAEHRGEPLTQAQKDAGPRREDTAPARYLLVLHLSARARPAVISSKELDSKTTAMPTTFAEFRPGLLRGSVAVVRLHDLKLVCHAPVVAQSSANVRQQTAFSKELGMDVSLVNDFHDQIGEAISRTLIANKANFRMPGVLK